MKYLTNPRTLSEHADGRWRAVQYSPPFDPEQVHHPIDQGE
jgi:hypothetical protein